MSWFLLNAIDDYPIDLKLKKLKTQVYVQYDYLPVDLREAYHSCKQFRDHRVLRANSGHGRSVRSAVSSISVSGIVTASIITIIDCSHMHYWLVDEKIK